MADPKLVDILNRGSEIWNLWRERQPEEATIDLAQANLYEANLRRANLSKVNLREANLIGADLNEADLSGAILIEAALSSTDLKHANLDHADLSNANLSGADLRGVSLNSANLSRAVLSSYSPLFSVSISRANFMDRILMDRANLSGASLHSATLNSAILNDIDLSNADLSNANLSDCDLFRADLSNAILNNTNLDGTNFHCAFMWRTVFTNVDLRRTKGLLEIEHRGPSIIQLHSIQLPQDGSALHFLHGAGVPDDWINLYRVIMMHPIQYHSCFISYAHQDDDLARRLHADLQDKGVRCWFAPHDMKIGDKIHHCIDEAIHLQDKLLLILSQHSVTSDWVEHEVETAMAREHRDKRTILFPIRLDNAILERPYTGWAATVQNERHIGDFTEWKNHDRYKAAFDRLLRDLRTQKER